MSHNALAVYWNPLESPAKVNIAVQCLSTDFSTQKGVKGLPLHIQIDTYDDPRDTPGGPVYHRGYCQIKVRAATIGSWHLFDCSSLVLLRQGSREKGPGRGEEG